jgi:hypothetical protein
MTWQPVDRATLETWIADALAERDDDVRAAWADMCIEPEKWRCSPWGDAGGGFWAVAIDGDEVLWFNDIEQGFNRSRFTERGVIAEYRCNQDDLDAVLERLAHDLSDRTWARLRPTDVPADLVGPGTIVKRQTSYWDLRADGLASYRVHVRGKVEARFVSAAYPTVQLLTRHPLLDMYAEPGATLFFAGRPSRSRVLADAIAGAVRDASGGWRSLADHGTSADAIARALSSGHGLVLRAPAPICAAAAAILEAAGVAPSVVIGARGGAARPLQVLLLGVGALVADAFAFERLP